MLIDFEMKVEWVEPGEVVPRSVCRLYYEILYRDFGVSEESDWHQQDETSAYAVVRSGSHLLGAVRLMGESGHELRQIRQIAVEPAVQGMGIGRLLMTATEHRAEAEGAREVWLNAREQAYRFYLAQGYAFESDTFISALTGIPHRRMGKAVGPFEGLVS